MNPRAPIKKVHFGNAPIDEVLDIRGFNLNAILELDPEFLTEHRSTSTTTRSSRSCSRSDKPFDGQKLESFLSGMIQVYGPDLLRYKGILWMKGKNRARRVPGRAHDDGRRHGQAVGARARRRARSWCSSARSCRRTCSSPAWRNAWLSNDLRSADLAHRYGAARGAAPCRVEGRAGRALAGARSLGLRQDHAACTSSPAWCGRAKAKSRSPARTCARSEGARLDRWRGATVGIVLQALHLVQHLSVRDNLRLAQYLAQVPQDDARIADTLGALGVGDKGGAAADRAVAGRAAARGDRARGGEPARSCCSPTSRPPTSTTPRRRRSSTCSPSRPRATARRWWSRRTTRA